MKDIDSNIQSCTTCQRVNKRIERPAHSLHPIKVHSPWHRIGIDLIGPLPRMCSGNSYIVTCSDLQSGQKMKPFQTNRYCSQILVQADYKAW